MPAENLDVDYVFKRCNIRPDASLRVIEDVVIVHQGKRLVYERTRVYGPTDEVPINEHANVLHAARGINSQRPNIPPAPTGPGPWPPGANKPNGNS